LFSMTVSSRPTLNYRRECPIPSWHRGTLRAPETAKGHVFITPEDEHGTVNTILRPHVTQRYKPVVPRTWLLLIEG